MLENFMLTVDKILYGGECSFEEAMTAVCIRDYQMLVRRLPSSEASPMDFTEKLIQINPDCIIIMNEIGSGIIPLEKEERLWREEAGRCGCLIAKHAEKVIRVCCGCGIVIKGEQL